MKAMESPLPCLTNQPSNSSHNTNTKAVEFQKIKREPSTELEEFESAKEEPVLAPIEWKQTGKDAISWPLENDISVKSEITKHIKKEYLNELASSDTIIHGIYDRSPLEPVGDSAFSVNAVAGTSELSAKADKRQTSLREITSKPPVNSQRSRDLVDKKHKCSYCEKSFACGYSLTRHVRIHTGEQCYKCDVCDKIFTTRSSKIRHDRTHISEGTYKCEFCNKIFKRPILLTEHQVEHTGQKPFACGVCGKAFTKRFQLASHLKTHNQKFDSKDPSVIEVCELCQQGFPDKDTLIEHLKEHVAEKALQSDLVDSSNDLDSTVNISDPIVVTPICEFSQFDSSTEEIKKEPTEPNTFFGTTIVADNSIADAQLSLESNVIYIVGEDGTLQPQINYDLVAPQFENHESASFIEAPMDTDSALTTVFEDIKPSIDTPVNAVESCDISDFAATEDSKPFVTESDCSQLIASGSLLVTSEHPVGASNSAVVVGSGQLIASDSPLVAQTSLTANSLVIAQADTTSLDSLKTDDEDSLSPSLGEGEDILAIACKEILIVPISEPENIQRNSPVPPIQTTSIVHNPATTMHTSDKEKKFHCEYCDKSFTQRNNLDSHTRTHTKEKPFKCFHCDMAFSQRWSLTRHIRIHTGEKPFKCAFCDASFRVKGEKTEHEKANHMNERNERIAQQARIKTHGNGTANESVSMEMIEITPQREVIFNNDINTNNSNFPESSAQSMSHTDDSDSKSDYESIQSSQYGDSDMKFSLENSQDNMTGHMTSLANENEIKFHYGSEEYMDTMTPNSGPVLTTLAPAEFIMDEKVFNHHCDFCESSFATRTELVQHFSAHTG